MEQFFTEINRKFVIINLDPANETMKYKVKIKIIKRIIIFIIFIINLFIILIFIYFFSVK